jgi:hypothetical protein
MQFRDESVVEILMKGVPWLGVALKVNLQAFLNNDFSKASLVKNAQFNATVQTNAAPTMLSQALPKRQ